ncbi:hypothetical protein [Marinimicrobium locisalis]|uniref:hypothetical protein n=1 Tax=Marinimicrobium locisalis TaxID=546022 RepID=UPI003221607B
MKDLESFEFAIEEVISYFHRQKSSRINSRRHSIICSDIKDLEKVKHYLQVDDSNILAVFLTEGLGGIYEKHDKRFPIYRNYRSFLKASDTEEIYISESAYNINLIMIAKELNKTIRPFSDYAEMA